MSDSTLPAGISSPAGGTPVLSVHEEAASTPLGAAARSETIADASDKVPVAGAPRDERVQSILDGVDGAAVRKPAHDAKFGQGGLSEDKLAPFYKKVDALPEWPMSEVNLPRLPHGMKASKTIDRANSMEEAIDMVWSALKDIAELGRHRILPRSFPLVLPTRASDRGRFVHEFAGQLFVVARGGDHLNPRGRCCTLTGFKGAGKSTLLRALVIAAAMLAPKSLTVGYANSPGMHDEGGRCMSPLDMMADLLQQRGRLVKKEGGSLWVPNWALSNGASRVDELDEWTDITGEGVLLVIDEAHQLYDQVPMSCGRAVRELDGLGQTATKTVVFLSGSSATLHPLMFSMGSHPALKSFRGRDHRTDLNDRKWTKGPFIRGFTAPEEVRDFALQVRDSVECCDELRQVGNLAAVAAKAGTESGAHATAMQRRLSEMEEEEEAEAEADEPETPVTWRDAALALLGTVGSAPADLLRGEVAVRRLCESLVQHRAEESLSRQMRWRDGAVRILDFVDDGMDVNSVHEVLRRWADQGVVLLNEDLSSATLSDSPIIQNAFRIMQGEVAGLHIDEMAAMLSPAGRNGDGPLENLLLDCICTKKHLEEILTHASAEVRVWHTIQAFRPDGGWALESKRPTFSMTTATDLLPPGEMRKEDPDMYGADAIINVGTNADGKEIVVRIQVKGSEGKKPKEFGSKGKVRDRLLAGADAVTRRLAALYGDGNYVLVHVLLLTTLFETNERPWTEKYKAGIAEFAAIVDLKFLLNKHLFLPAMVQFAKRSSDRLSIYFD